MSEENYVKIKNHFIVKQPIGDFLVCSIPWKDMLKISSSEPRNYNEELDNYLGIQRELQDDKVAELRKYVTTKDATFPNSIITTINMDFFEKEGNTINIKIIDSENVSKRALSIIDGQHRIAGFRSNLGLMPEPNFDLIVAIYLGLQIEEQAYLFSVINNKQKPLNASLVQDLNDLFYLKTPEKITHTLTKLFNSQENSPWKDKIKVLGKNIIKRGKKIEGILSQYTFAKQIIELIYSQKDYVSVRDVLKKSNNDRIELLDFYKTPKNKIFWNFYMNSKDKQLYNLLLNYFNAIQGSFNIEWGDSDFILTKTTGYIALMRFLKYLVLEKNISLDDMDFNFFEDVFEKIKTSGDLKPLTADYYESGAKGQSKLFNEFKTIYD
jgi:DGQHR domain-containing protein